MQDFPRGPEQTHRTDRRKANPEEILRNSVNVCIKNVCIKNLRKSRDVPLGELGTSKAFPSPRHSEQVYPFPVSCRSWTPPSPLNLLSFLPFFNLQPVQTHLHFRWDFCLQIASWVNSSFGLLRNQAQMKGEPLPPPPRPHPPFPACSSAGFQWLIEQCVRFTELGVGLGSSQRQSQLPGQFPYESS